MSYLKTDNRLVTFLCGVWIVSLLASAAYAGTIVKPPTDKFLPVSVMAKSDIHYLSGLGESLGKLNEAIMSGNSLAVSDQVAAVIKYKKRLGSKNLFFVSRYLVALASQLARSGNLSRAAQTAKDAVEISPDDYRAGFALAVYSFQADKANVKAYLMSALLAVVSFVKFPHNLLIVLNRMLIFLIPAFVVAFVLFVFSGFAVSARLLSRDIARKIGARRKIAKLIIGLLMAISFVAGGVIGLALAAPILTWGYLKSTRRKITVALLIFLALMPLVVEGAARGAALEKSPLNSAIRHYLAENWETSSVRSLIGASQRGPESTELWFALANLFMRAGDLDGAQRYLDRALAREASNVMAINETANLHFKRKEYRDAQRLYKKALKIKPGSAELHYNMNKTYSALFSTEKAVEEFNAAMRLDKSMTEGFVRQEDDERIKVVSFVADLKKLPLLKKEIGELAGERSKAVWSAIAGKLDRNLYLAGAAVYLLALGIATALWRRGSLFTSCASCGVAFQPAIKSPGQEDYRCNQCVVLYSSRRKIDKNQKAKKLGQIKRHNRKVSGKANLLNYILPGLGNCYIGRYGSGVIALCITAVFLVKLLYIFSPLTVNYGDAISVPVVNYLVWAGALVLFYIASIVMLKSEA